MNLNEIKKKSDSEDKNYKQNQDRGEISTEDVSSRVPFCVR